jgi:hypothetical protein
MTYIIDTHGFWPMNLFADDAETDYEILTWMIPENYE